MPEKDRNRREAVRLPGKSSSASDFTGEHTRLLPAQARVGDLSEGGLRLLVDWPEGSAFPVGDGDVIRFRLKVEGLERAFEILSVVRHMAAADSRGRVGVGVQFCGLERRARASLQQALVNLAMIRLRQWHAEEPAAAPAAPAAEAPPRRRRRHLLGEILVEQGALDSERLGRFLTHEFSGRDLLGRELAERGLVDGEAVARALAEQARLEYLDPEVSGPDAALAAVLPREELARCRCVPVGEEDGAVLLAASVPPDMRTLEELRGIVGRRVRIRIASEEAMAGWLKRIYNLEGAPFAGKLRFPVQLHVEYRVLGEDRQPQPGAPPATGLTRSIWHEGLVIAGPLPAGFDSERGSANLLEVVVDCPEMGEEFRLVCRPFATDPGESEEEHHISCRIEVFPEGGESAWSRACMVMGTTRFHRSSP